MKNRLAVVSWWVGLVIACLSLLTTLTILVLKSLTANEVISVAVGGAATAASGLVCFAICYVLSGSFWTPPNTSFE